MLSKQNIVITRPQGQDKKLRTILATYNPEAIYHLPMLAIKPLDSQAIVFDPTIHYHHIIFVSLNAIQYSQQIIPPSILKNAQCYTLGPSSFQALKKIGIHSHYQPKNSTSETLLSLFNCIAVNNQNILIVRGMGGRNIMGQNLKKKGAKVHYLELYQREPINYIMTDIPKKINYVLLTSGESFINWHKQTKAQHICTPIIVPSQRIASLAKKYNYPFIAIAQHANDVAMVQQLIICHNGR